jgi:predicted nucleic acid-binding protein
LRLFLDTSVLLAASASPYGASREIFRLAPAHGWTLIATPYILAEVIRNLPDFPLVATTEWLRLRRQLLVMDDVLTLDRPVIFLAGKDRPILFGALAWADVLLTLDRGDFESLLGGAFYGLSVLKPGAFVARHRASENP